jgi:hypothetical protein
MQAVRWSRGGRKSRKWTLLQGNLHITQGAQGLETVRGIQMLKWRVCLGEEEEAEEAEKRDQWQV